VFAAILFAVFWTRDMQEEPPARIGRMWTAKVGDTRLLCYLTAEERGRRRAVTGGRNPSYTTDHYFRYRLHVRTLADAGLVQEVLLGDVKRNDRKPAPEIIGVIGDVLWLWHSQLESRALPNLTVRQNEAAMRQTQPEAVEILPRESKQYKALASPAALITRGRDARFYLVDPDRFTLTPFAATDLPPTTFTTQAEGRFDFIRSSAEGRTMTSPFNQMTRNLLTAKGMWYGMLSESERGGMAKWISVDARPSGDVARSFYAAPTVHDGRYWTVDLDAVKRVGDSTFVQGGFIVRHDWKPWQLSNPDSAVVLAKRHLGATEPWDVVRLAHDGTVVWRTTTAMAAVGEFLDADPYFVIAGEPLPMGMRNSKADNRERIIMIDERTGAAKTVVVTTGEVVK
jgi:hypothetical protein